MNRLIAVISAVLLLTSLSSAQEITEPEAREIRHALVADVTAARIEKDIRKLVNFGTRHTLSDTESDTRGHWRRTPLGRGRI